MNNMVVPFGKYQGRAVEEMMVDASYCEWLAAQPWFKDRYSNIYNLIINYGGESQDSPEHNALQARFIEESLCSKLMYVSTKTEEYDPWGSEWTNNIDLIEFENVFDVRFWYDTTYVFCVECKPLIGDDYPTILRQINNQRKSLFDRNKTRRSKIDTKRTIMYSTFDQEVHEITEPNDLGAFTPTQKFVDEIKKKIVLVYERIETTTVSKDQVKKIFALSNIDMISLSEIEEVI